MKRVLDVLGSARLACALLVCLALSTWLGTLAQVELGLHAAQQRYFESFVLVHWLGSVPVPLPGANLVLTLLFLNLVIGGIVTLRKRRSTVGVLIAHVGIGILLLAGFVKYAFARDGHVTLYEGQSASSYQSYYRYEVSVAHALEGGQLEEFVIPHEDVIAAAHGPVELSSPELPFVLELGDFVANSRPVGASSALLAGPSVDGIQLRAQPLEKEAERNIAGLSAKVRYADGEQSLGLLWSASGVPWTVHLPSGEHWAVELRKERYPLPFEIALDEFRKVDHPRTSMPRSFESDVTVSQEEVARPVRIQMNEPLRQDGLVVYQASWGPAEAPPGTPLFSTFAVVENPADTWPLIGCLVIAFGLALHFGTKLVRWMRKSAKQSAKSAVPRLVSSPTRRAAAVLACLGLSASATAAGPEGESTRPSHWSAETIALAETLPIQDGGRIKPLSTYASFTLLRLNGRRSIQLEDGERLNATEWLLDTLFRTDRAAGYAMFLVQDDAVLRALDLEPERKKRDRWSYEDLAPGIPRLFELAHEYSRIPSAERSSLERQVVDLAGNVDTFLSLARHFDFVRYGVVVDDPELSPIFGEVELAPLSAILAHADRLNASATGREVLDAAVEIAATSRALALMPPVAEGTEAWSSAADLARRALVGERPPAEHLELLRMLEAVYENRDDAVAGRASLSELADGTRLLAKRRGELESVDRERLYYRLDLVGWALRAFAVAFLFCALVWLWPGTRWPYRLAVACVGSGTVALTAAIVLRCVIRARPPVSTLYETVLFVTATGAAIALFLEAFGRQRIALSAAAVLGLAGVFVANGYETLDAADTMPSLVAVLDTNFWLATHVTAITLGYSAGLLAALLASFWIVIDRWQAFRGAAGPPILRELARMVYGVTCFALFFSLVGTILGGIWANDSWGRFWGWDPKENGALLIVITQTLILHGRLTGLLKSRGLCLAAAFGGTVVAFSWWGVNLLGVGLHSYGFTSGVHQVLWTYYGLQWAIVALGFLGRRTKRAQALVPNG